eukprot:11242574-Karenia_brevis.AAC.1
MPSNELITVQTIRLSRSYRLRQDCDRLWLSSGGNADGYSGSDEIAAKLRHDCGQPQDYGARLTT